MIIARFVCKQIRKTEVRFSDAKPQCKVVVSLIQTSSIGTMPAIVVADPQDFLEISSEYNPELAAMFTEGTEYTLEFQPVKGK